MSVVGCEPYANGEGWWHVWGCEHVDWEDDSPELIKQQRESKEQ